MVFGKICKGLYVWIGSVFPPDELWIGLDTYTNCIWMYDLLLKVWLKGCAACFICIDWWGKGWPMVACPFRPLVVLDRCQYLLNMNFLMYGLLFLQLSTTIGCFRPRTFFEKRIELVSIDLLYFIFTFYAQDNQQKYLSLATDSPCGVWGRGWITCLLCGGSILGLSF